MSKGAFVIQSRPAEGEALDDYNRWYAETHLQQVLAIPGFVSARRYRLHDSADVGPSEPTHLTIYELDADDLATPVAELRSRSAAGLIDPSPALPIDPPPTVRLYELI